MFKRKRTHAPAVFENLVTFKATPVINGYGGGCVLEGKYSVFRPDCGPRMPR